MFSPKWKHTVKLVGTVIYILGRMVSWISSTSVCVGLTLDPYYLFWLTIFISHKPTFSGPFFCLGNPHANSSESGNDVFRQYTFLPRLHTPNMETSNGGLEQ